QRPAVPVAEPDGRAGHQCGRLDGDLLRAQVTRRRQELDRDRARQRLLRDLAPLRPDQGVLREIVEAWRRGEAPLGPVALLELLARAARAGVVAPDLRGAAHERLLRLVVVVMVIV